MLCSPSLQIPFNKVRDEYVGRDKKIREVVVDTHLWHSNVGCIPRGCIEPWQQVVQLGRCIEVELCRDADHVSEIQHRVSPLVGNVQHIPRTLP